MRCSWCSREQHAAASRQARTSGRLGAGTMSGVLWACCEVGRHVGHVDLHVQPGLDHHLPDLHDALVERPGEVPISTSTLGGRATS